MPWKECGRVDQRQEFVRRAQEPGANVAGLCRAYGISRKTGYKWLKRYRSAGEAGLEDRSRRPHRSPGQTSPDREQAVCQLRQAHPAWGGRKIHRRLLEQDRQPPAASTITGILRRGGLLDPAESAKHRAYQRFEREAPNQLWQMDFKGHFALADGQRCHPLTLLDDHSRFNLALDACADESGPTVQKRLERVFQAQGLPEAMLMDNGSPWGNDELYRHTPLTAWLLRLGIQVIHGRPWHPQTQGKEERFHRTLKAEVLAGRVFADLASIQGCFDVWREVYNQQRPHEALGLGVPAERYHPSPRSFPEPLPAIEYPAGDIVRRVAEGGKIRYQGRRYRVGRAFAGYPVALRPTEIDGLCWVYFCQQSIAQIDLATRQRYPL